MGEFETLSRKLDGLKQDLETILNAKKETENQGDKLIDGEWFLKPETAAKRMDTTRQTLYKYVQKGTLKVYRFGTETRYKLSELLEFPQLINK